MNLVETVTEVTRQESTQLDNLFNDILKRGIFADISELCDDPLKALKVLADNFVIDTSKTNCQTISLKKLFYKINEEIYGGIFLPGRRRLKFSVSVLEKYLETHKIDVSRPPRHSGEKKRKTPNLDYYDRCRYNFPYRTKFGIYKHD